VPLRLALKQCDDAPLSRVYPVGVSIALLILLTGLGCRTTEWRDGEAEKRVKELDTPFHFLLHLDGYRVERVARESDMFSTWGDLTLLRREGRAPADAGEPLLKAAKKAGWKQVDDPAVEVDPSRLAKLGVPPGQKPLELAQAVGKKSRPPPTRYGCRAWIVENGSRIIVAYRVDSE
jgi:hypothetical protein